ncbi:LytR/AlgR family response regulator transcription factor [Mucilaginibacter myungsuensis]|uniref:Response regulator transcription factor n=1 Tax=Mucilaginibacter myungsuensis TaxID=649104 RepID=A0A929KWD1_9SPHI|nr:response regulator transcription factor [Mucilaginibacter myungsuensis]MBE9661907.1 response regulator transcription factor [Mucilaginibacter myungsuensis]MDN3599659.1 response regulator transcription factor [Mucilaginibacter myungsuensis]
MVRCLVVDDEKLARELMEDNVSKVPYLKLQGTCKNAMEAMEFLRREPVDLIFLDIQMPGISGVQFLNSLSNPPMVIMVTAYDNYALEGFNLDVVDYILKPFSFERFLKAVNKAYELISLRQQKDNGSATQTVAAPTAEAVQVAPAKTDPDYLFVNADYSVVRINIPDITYVEGLKDYIKIYLKSSDKAVITRLSMRFMEEKLPEATFARVHKSYIVALDKVTAFKKNRLMIGQTEIPLSDNYKDKVLAYIGHDE